MLLIRNLAIKQKLIVIVMLTCLLALMVVGGAFVFWEWRGLRSNLVEKLFTEAQITADNCKAALTFEDTADAEKTLKALKADPSIVFGCVYKKNGNVFVNYARTNTDKEHLTIHVQQAGYSFSDNLLTVFEPIVLDNETIGTVCLRSDLSLMHAALRRNAQNTAAVLFLAVIAAYIVSRDCSVSFQDRFSAWPNSHKAYQKRKIIPPGLSKTAMTRSVCLSIHSMKCLSKYRNATQNWSKPK